MPLKAKKCLCRHWWIKIHGANWALEFGCRIFAKGLDDKESNYVLGWSHEEVLTAIASNI